MNLFAPQPRSDEVATLVFYPHPGGWTLHEAYAERLAGAPVGDLLAMRAVAFQLTFYPDGTTFEVQYRRRVVRELFPDDPPARPVRLRRMC